MHTTPKAQLAAELESLERELSLAMESPTLAEAVRRDLTERVRQLKIKIEQSS